MQKKPAPTKAAIAEVFAKEEEMYETVEPRAQKLSAQLNWKVIHAK